MPLYPRRVLVGLVGLLSLGGASACGSDSSTSPDASTQSGIDAAPLGPGQRVFISSAEYASDFMKGESRTLVEVGTQMCTDLANAAGLGVGPWRAWLSSTTVNARDVVTGPGPFYDVAGKVIFPDRFELLGASAGPFITESGDALPTIVNGMQKTHKMFTGTTASGRYDDVHGNCADWTVTTGAFITAPAPGSVPFSECVEGGMCAGVSCATYPGHVYCFEIR